MSSFEVFSFQRFMHEYGVNGIWFFAKYKLRLNIIHIDEIYAVFGFSKRLESL